MIFCLSLRLSHPAGVECRAQELVAEAEVGSTWRP